MEEIVTLSGGSSHMSYYEKRRQKDINLLRSKQLILGLSKPLLSAKPTIINPNNTIVTSMMSIGHKAKNSNHPYIPIDTTI